MKNSTRILLISCMAIGVIVFVDSMVFAAMRRSDYSDAPAFNRGYVAHFPEVLSKLLGQEGVLFRFATAVLLLIIPGLIFLARHSETKKQSFLTYGLMGICIGGIMLWANM